MTLYLNLRQGALGYGLRDVPDPLEGDGLVAKPTMTPLKDADFAGRLDNKSVVFAVHGFNVSYERGLRSVARLETALKPLLPRDFVVVGVLWPGDFLIPAINYPGEWRDAVNGGRHLARYADTWLRRARDIHFLSHSLGGRLALEATARLGRKAGQVCLTAPVTDDDCLESPYDASIRNARGLTYLASKRDMVLKAAYRIGDWAGDLFFGDDDAASRGALGWHGARWPRTQQPTIRGEQIDKNDDYEHGSYFPPGKMAEAPTQQHARVATYAAQFLQGGPARW
jgi:esterase/lipase superfamily enzyme